MRPHSIAAGLARPLTPTPPSSEKPANSPAKPRSSVGEIDSLRAALSAALAKLEAEHAKSSGACVRACRAENHPKYTTLSTPSQSVSQLRHSLWGLGTHGVRWGIVLTGFSLRCAAALADALEEERSRFQCLADLKCVQVRCSPAAE